MRTDLTPRERWMVAGGAAAVLAVVIWLGIIEPYQESLSLMESKIASRSRQLEEVRDLRTEYLVLKNQLDEVERRLQRAGRNFSLFSFVEELTVRTGIKGNLLSMRPQTASAKGEFREEAVEIRLEKIRLNQLVQFLHAVEGADVYLQVKSLRIKPRFDDPALLDVTMVISYYQKGA